MRIIPFPGRVEEDGEESWHLELDAALRGETTGPVADSWRELRADVRALAPPIGAAFEQELRERLGEPTTVSPRRRDVAASAPSVASRRSRVPGRVGTASIVAAAAALLVAVVVAAPWSSGGRAPVSAPATHAPASAVATSGAVESAPAQGPASPSAPGRVDQLAASITLGSTPAGVQSIADRVARLAVSAGGFVRSSQVQVQREGVSEASIDLSLPSAGLSSSLESLGGLAPVRAESQTLQDITGAYEAAHRQLADASAERQALLRALAGASTQGQIESLRARLSLARGAIARAVSALRAVSQKASTADVQVTVVGNAAAGAGEGLTVRRGLHDAGRVLTVALVVLLIGGAVLVPLAILLGAALLGRRAWRRNRRERALAQP
jgi:hypothetical protein